MTKLELLGLTLLQTYRDKDTLNPKDYFGIEDEMRYALESREKNQEILNRELGKLGCKPFDGDKVKMVDVVLDALREQGGLERAYAIFRVDENDAEYAMKCIKHHAHGGGISLGKVEDSKRVVMRFVEKYGCDPVKKPPRLGRDDEAVQAGAGTVGNAGGN